MTDLAGFRQAKDDFFANDPHSPLLPEQRRDFHGLVYYDEAPDLAIVATPEVFEEQELVEMQTSTGESTDYLRWARVPFAINGTEVALTLYRDPADNGLFLPFQDANRGGETYGAGRYLDVEELADGRVVLDFNYAYNPYCAYNDAWSCPPPPPENRLDVAIQAGEKTFHAD